VGRTERGSRYGSSLTVPRLLTSRLRRTFERVHR
jgi:hypothetical protein